MRVAAAQYRIEHLFRTHGTNSQIDQHSEGDVGEDPEKLAYRTNDAVDLTSGCYQASRFECNMQYQRTIYDAHAACLSRVCGTSTAVIGFTTV